MHGTFRKLISAQLIDASRIVGAVMTPLDVSSCLSCHIASPLFDTLRSTYKQIIDRVYPSENRTRAVGGSATPRNIVVGGMTKINDFILSKSDEKWRSYSVNENVNRRQTSDDRKTDRHYDYNTPLAEG